MAVPLSAIAAADLEAIGEVIARDNPGRAPALVQAMRAHVLALDRNPDIRAPQAEYGQGVRLLPHGRYLIFYSVRGSQPLVERARPSARATGPLRVVAGALLRCRKALTWGPPLPRIAGLHSSGRFRRG